MPALASLCACVKPVIDALINMRESSDRSPDRPIAPQCPTDNVRCLLLFVVVSASSLLLLMLLQA